MAKTWKGFRVTVLADRGMIFFCSKQLFELDKKHREIDALVEKARQATVATEEEVNKMLFMSD